ncbi:MAG: transporter substrate-binding domain-containing protein [Desulfobacteraceae bacterium]|nr:transporter substrate-binding domain-containing protein [Desulfobacteraceae bacterium]
MKPLLFLSAILIATVTATQASAKVIVLTVDSRNWYPFTYVDEGEPKGMHIDLVKKALTTLGYDLSIIPYPKKRCLHVVEKGRVDGMISISHHPDLASGMAFPEDAATERESAWRLMQVDHVVVTTDKRYEFEDDLTTVPEPVRIPRGETLTLELKKIGKKIDEAETDLQNFKKLMRDKSGAVITTSIIAEKMNLDPEMAGRFHISATPMASRSYFLTFSNKSNISNAEKKKIWDEIKIWRDDYVYMLQLYAQY